MATRRPRVVRYPEVETMTRAECEQWRQNPGINPITNRPISTDRPGGVFDQIAVRCSTVYGIELATGPYVGTALQAIEDAKERSSHIEYPITPEDVPEYGPISIQVPTTSGQQNVNGIRCPADRQEWEGFADEVLAFAVKLHVRFPSGIGVIPRADYSVLEAFQDHYHYIIEQGRYFTHLNTHKIRRAKEVADYIIDRARIVDGPDLTISEIKAEAYRLFYQFMLNPNVTTYEQRLMILKGLINLGNRLLIIASFLKRDQAEVSRAMKLQYNIFDFVMICRAAEAEAKRENVTRQFTALEDSETMGSDLSYTDSVDADGKPRSRKYGSSYRRHAHLSETSRPLPDNRTRQELLQEIKRDCRNLIDLNSRERFDRMKKKNLHTIVKIKGANNNSNNCYLAKGLYETWKSAYERNVPLLDPATRMPLTAEHLDEILSKIRLIEPNAADPRVSVQQPVSSLIELDMVHITKTYHPYGIEVPFYKIYIRTRREPDGLRLLGGENYFLMDLGFVPAGVEPSQTGSSDLSSAVMALKINSLFESGRLLINGFIPFGGYRLTQYLNKDYTFWLDPNDPMTIDIGKFNDLMQALNSQ